MLCCLCLLFMYLNINILLNGKYIYHTNDMETTTFQCESPSPWFLCSITINSISSMICAVRSRGDINKIKCNNENQTSDGKTSENLSKRKNFTLGLIINGDTTRCSVNMTTFHDGLMDWSWDCSLSSLKVKH